MKNSKLKRLWKKEGRRAFRGWDFSWLDKHAQFSKPSFDYKEIVLNHLQITDNLLDIGTGGGEFLLSLNHPYQNTFVTEGYLPNYRLCKRTIAKKGITVKFLFDKNVLPYPDEFFDIVIDRHEYYNPKEVKRVLKKGGLFITEQVGSRNNELLSRRITEYVSPYPEVTLVNYLQDIKMNGLTVLKQNSSNSLSRFFAVGAIVYYANIVKWEFPGFSVNNCFDKLLEVYKEISEVGYVESNEDRFLIMARKD